MTPQNHTFKIAALLTTLALPACGSDADESSTPGVGGKSDADVDTDDTQAASSACADLYYPAEPGAPIRVGTEGDFPPFNSVDANGAPIGWEVDYLQSVMARLGLDYTLTLHGWDGCCSNTGGQGDPPPLAEGELFSDTFEGTLDLAIASISRNPVRQTVFEFSNRYGFTPLFQRIAFRAADAAAFDFAGEGLDALDGKILGTQVGTNGAAYLTALAQDPDLDFIVEFFDTHADAIAAVVAGDIDAAYGASNESSVTEGVATGVLQTSNALLELDAEGHDEIWGVDGGSAFMAGPAFDGRHPGLMEAINCVIEEISNDEGVDGSTIYETLGEQWAAGGNALVYCNPRMSNLECEAAMSSSVED